MLGTLNILFSYVATLNQEIQMKTSNPYGANYPVKVPPDTISAQNRQAAGKAKARYPHGEAQPVDNKARVSGPMKTRALAPGSSPTGS